MDGPGRQTAILVAAILLAGLGTALALTGIMRPGQSVVPSGPLASASFPATANGHDVLSVADAMAVQAGDDASELAVAGWYQQSELLSCPAPRFPLVPVIEGPCALRGFMMANPESIVHVRSNGWDMGPPSGRFFEVVFDGPEPAWQNPFPRIGDSVPTAAVLVGHFNDARAAGCQAEDRQNCGDRFVVTAVAWANGVDSP